VINLGDPVPDLALEVYNAGGGLQNATAVVLTITLPDGSTASPAVTNDSAGKYSAVYITTMAGRHTVHWAATGTNACVFDDEFDVESPAFGIVSLAVVKEELKIFRTNDDEKLLRMIIAASDICEGPEGTNRTWRRTVITDEPHDGGKASVQLWRNPVLSITSVTADGSALAASDYDLDAGAGRLYSASGTYFPWSGRRQTLLVSYVAGAAVVPAGVRWGVIELVRHMLSSSRGGSGIPRQEEPDYTTVGAGYLIPNRVVTAWRNASGY
jgi:hypothetical protein